MARNRKYLQAFVSKFGKHKLESIGKDLDLDKLHKVAAIIVKEGSVNSNNFAKIATVMGKGELLLRTLNTLHKSGKIATSLLNNDGNTGIFHTGITNLPSVNVSNASRLGKNDAMYFKTSFSVGRKMSARMKKLKNGPYTETITKDFVDSNTDYQTGVKRKQLLIKNGFNEKNFAFLLEDHYLTIDDWLKIYNVEKIFGNERSKNSILNMSRKKYGCALEMRNTLR